MFNLLSVLKAPVLSEAVGSYMLVFCAWCIRGDIPTVPWRVDSRRTASFKLASAQAQTSISFTRSVPISFCVTIRIWRKLLCIPSKCMSDDFLNQWFPSHFEQRWQCVKCVINVCFQLMSIEQSYNINSNRKEQNPEKSRTTNWI